MKKKTKYQIISWIIVIILFIIIVIGVGGLVLVQIGKYNLKKNATSQIPDAMKEAVEGSLNAEEAEKQELEAVEWEDDWIRYNGKVYDYNENILTFLCMGVDVNNEIKQEQKGTDSGQADALFLLILNPDTKEIHIVGVDRNTMVDFDVYDKDGKYISTNHGQIALAHGYGDGKDLSAKNTVKAVSDVMFGLPIHGFCAINMAAIPIINDAVDGIELTVLEDCTSIDESLVEGETLRLMGRQSYHYVKYRNLEAEESARTRLGRQKQYLVEYVHQAKRKFKTDVSLPLTLYQGITPYMTTDVTVDEIIYLASTAAGYSFSEDNLILVPGETDLSEEYDKFYPDDKKLKQIIIDIFYTDISLDVIE